MAAAVCCHLHAVAWLNQGQDFARRLAAAHQGELLWKDALQKMGLGEDHPWLAASRNNLAAIDLLAGDYLGAKELFEGSSDAWSQSLGPKDAHVGVAEENLAMLRSVLGQQDQAEQALAAAKAIFDESLPKDRDDPVWIPCRTAASVLAWKRADSARRKATPRTPWPCWKRPSASSIRTWRRSSTRWPRPPSIRPAMPRPTSTPFAP